ncbi:MAG TPA: ribbon-helix-helix protein, CopG family [Desulfatiglandales bacterium]|nr:ribbon-helix-helix protein, CopG family [Desulfatiglandales bacterium]
MINKTKRKVLNISLSPELYNEVENLAKEEAKAKGEFVREVIRQYITRDRRWKQLRKWGEETVKRLGIEDENEIEDIVAQYRQEQS